MLLRLVDFFVIARGAQKKLRLRREGNIDDLNMLTIPQLNLYLNNADIFYPDMVSFELITLYCLLFSLFSFLSFWLVESFTLQFSISRPFWAPIRFCTYNRFIRADLGLSFGDFLVCKLALSFHFFDQLLSKSELCTKLRDVPRL